MNRIRKYTLVIFLERAEATHGKNFDYSQVKEHHINGAMSCIPIKCNICQYEWQPSINNHINNKKGCPDCAGQVPWNLERFKNKANKVHGDKCDYSQITEDQINGVRSNVPIKCNTRQYEWKPTIHDHINGKTGCPDCAGVVPWNLERFKNKAQKVHGDKYDYSHVKECYIKGKDSNVPVKCNLCEYEWTPSISNHINHGKGCSNCAGNAQWNLERFKNKAEKIHGNKCDYSQITDQDIVNQK